MANKKIQTVRLTDAQLSALQCAGILDGRDDLTADEDVLRLSVQGAELVVSVTTRPAIVRAICDLSNAEDATATRFALREPVGFLAARAALALTNLMVTVSRLQFGPSVGQSCTVRGVACRITAVLPMGTVEVEAADGSGGAWRVSGLEV